MEGEGKAFAEVMAVVAASMAYARFISTAVRPGKLRAAALIPIVVLLPLLPWHFSSVYLRSTLSFFLAWLATFRLLLLGFGLGTLSPSLPFVSFLALSFLPVKLPGSQPPAAASASARILPGPFLLKLLLFMFPMSLYQYKDQIHPHLLLLVTFLHVFLAFITLFSLASFLGALLDLDLEPQFDAPYLSTSLQEFWGRRWNLVVNGILRSSVYVPVRARFGAAAGVVGTFAVSGLMHEAMYYYLTLEDPTGEIFCFFLLHGVCTLAERELRRKSGWWWRCRPQSPAVSRVMVVLFVAGTGFKPMLLPIVRSGAAQKSLEESLAAARFLEDRSRYIVGRLGLVR